MEILPGHIELEPAKLLAFPTVRRSGEAMLPHTRALLAASAHAFVHGKKVAGIYDHSANRHLRIAAEARGDHLQGYDDDRSIRFGGTLPDLFDTGDGTFISLSIEGTTVQGYDRGSSGFYSADVTDRQVQIYDHSQAEWFAFSIQVA